MINQNRKYKIALVGDCLAGGGAEKVHAQLSVFFDSRDIEVHNCIFVDWVTYEYSGTLKNIGKIHPNGFFLLRKAKRFTAFRKFVKNHNFDCVIDFRMRTGFFQELLISKFVYDSQSIYSVRSGILKFYFPSNAFLSKLIYSNKRINTVSKAVSKKILQQELADNAYCIYNPVDFETIFSKQELFEVSESNYIIAVGRMNDEIKQFDKLIQAYSKSNLPHQNIKLLILGEGKNKESYQELVRDLDLEEKVIFKGFVQNPFPYYKNALFSVLSSKNEGFPNVIIEALALGTPVVSFDCFSGPNEIITHQQNGLIVEDQNFEKLTEAMNRMVDDQELYSQCKQNAKASVERFSLENIGKQWLDYLKFT